MSWPDRRRCVLHQDLSAPATPDDLAMHQQWIDHGTHVIHHAVAHDLHMTGVGIDPARAWRPLNFRPRVEHRHGHQARLHPWALGRGGAALATSLIVTVWLVLGLEKMPSAKLTSSSATFSRWARVPGYQNLVGSQHERRAADGGGA